jgi:diguanylate cyclase (GGDEF)-like protein
MRFGQMLNPFTFAGCEISSAKQIEDTLRELYSSKPHVAAAAGICLAATSAGLSGSMAAGIAAASIAVSCLIFRAIMEVLFVNRKPGPLNQRWTRLFVTGSLLSGLGWGVSGALLLYNGSPATQTIIVAVACAIVQGAAGRAYMIPGTAIINTALVLGLMAVAALANSNYLIIIGCVVYFWFLVSFITLMVKNRLRQLRAERLSVDLLEELTKKNEQLNAANARLAATAFEDPLTGLANRRKLDLVLNETLRRAQHDGSSVSLMMIDVDHFKSFNDTYGHQAGDQCLLAISQAIAGAVTPSLVARYGGEEFVVIMQDCDLGSAKLIAERVRLAVQLTDLAALPNSPPRQTISLGLLCCQVSKHVTAETLLSAADAALYQAKRQGRNRLCVQTELHQARDAVLSH